MTMTLANADGTAKVPLDFIVRVLDTASYSESSHAYPLCSGDYEPCRYAGNAFVPTLQMLGSIVPNGFCSGNMSRVTANTPVGDLTFLAFPCSINTWSGSEMKLEARGHDQAAGAVTQVNFSLVECLFFSLVLDWLQRGNFVENSTLHHTQNEGAKTPQNTPLKRSLAKNLGKSVDKNAFRQNGPFRVVCA